ncbi:MAG: hypothetical protein VX761_09405, partial [Planctomycetota bacterium]|nr:hypothetical protein [Planctomycetota bacterium]
SHSESRKLPHDQLRPPMSMLGTFLLYDFDPRWPKNINLRIGSANYNGFINGLESAIEQHRTVPAGTAENKAALPLS